ncbi:hypothetical protein CY34DRAFT_15597 [Suillus luteus UH-Slu-Lm8-n1]|uniref:Uncharacterized protein n=1 Tax=Suillus luteus UH-Slu-Lm8-n1 TaxID=930992 RepID=A0A0C9ZJJ4_9AGAM|nr:hypothetical protein CY34DRAFT_15597 [Suillus luteus UH-Slu-Lm8-n1]
MVDDFHALKELTILKPGMDFELAIDKSLLKLPVNLHRFDMMRVFFNHRRLVPDSEWARLTDVKTRIHELDELPRLLRLCPNISSLSMVDIKNPIKFESPGPVTHVNLQYLQVRGRFKLPSDDVGHGLFNATLSQTFASLNIAKWGRGHMKSSRHL